MFSRNKYSLALHFVDSDPDRQAVDADPHADPDLPK
jgi:hypothetical protein